MKIQPGVLARVPKVARYLTFSLRQIDATNDGLRTLSAVVDGESVVVGVGLSTVLALGRSIDGLRHLPSLSAAGLEVPSTPQALWIWLRGEDRGELYHRSRALVERLAPAFRLEEGIDAFLHEGGRDLTGYVDGTENPKGAKAFAAAIVAGRGLGLDGSSFVAVQRWVHRFERFDAMSRKEQDAAIGRRRSTNEEIDNAPVSAHVKRTAQESFAPKAFVVRRSMPYVAEGAAGLMFVAFGRTLDAFEAQLGRMTGVEDGVTDALFRFTRPVTGASYWCPPLKGNRLDLRALGL